MLTSWYGYSMGSIQAASVRVLLCVAYCLFFKLQKFEHDLALRGSRLLFSGIWICWRSRLMDGAEDYKMLESCTATRYHKN